MLEHFVIVHLAAYFLSPPSLVIIVRLESVHPYTNYINKRRYIMKSLIKSGLIVALVLLVIGCSSSNNPVGPIGPVDFGSAPGISNLSYSPKNANINEGGGAISVQIRFDFIDMDGDIATARLTSSNNGNLTLPITDMAGVDVGYITIYLTATTVKVMDITFQIWLIDSNGNESNKLSGNFKIS